MPALLEALGGGVASAGLNFLSQAVTAPLNYKYQKKMMNLQYDLNNKLIDKQNAYNSPANQMKLLKESGLNPYTIVGNLHSQQPSAGSVNQSNFKAFEAPQIDVLGNYQQILQAKNTQAQNELIKEQAEHQRIVNERERNTLPYDILSSKYNVEILGNQIKIGETQVSLNEAALEGQRISNYINDNIKDIQVGITQLQKDLLWYEKEFYKDTYDVKVNEAHQQLEKLKNENTYFAFEFLKAWEVIESLRLDNSLKSAILPALINSAYANVNLIQSEISKNISQANVNNANASNLGIQNKILGNQQYISDIELFAYNSYYTEYVESLRASWKNASITALRNQVGLNMDNWNNNKKEIDWAIDKTCDILTLGIRNKSANNMKFMPNNTTTTTTITDGEGVLTRGIITNKSFNP